MKKLSHGAFGNIYLTSDSTVLKVATRHPEILKQEYEILKTLNHPHIVKVYDYQENIGMTMEYLPGRDLFWAHQEQIPVSEVEIIWSQLIPTIIYLHNQNLVHCDLKLENLMFHQGHLTVIDFGFAGKNGECRKIAGSDIYRCPEQFGPDPIEDKPRDIWTLGIIFYELLSRGHVFPFTFRNETEFIDQIRNATPNYSRLRRSFIAEKIPLMLNKNPQLRPRITDL